MENTILCKTIWISLLFVCIAAAKLCTAETGLEGREQVTLKGATAQFGVDIAGGAIIDFHLTGSQLNPFTWNYPEKGDIAPRPMGHFICFDRWGQPSEQEQKNGMTFHGEAPYVVWKVLSKPSKQNGNISAQMLCTLPMGGMTLKRTIDLSDTSPVVKITEEITNINKLGRIFNIVQHPSIAPPFLDESVIVDSNAWKGYMQESPWPNPEEPVIYWPSIAYKGKLVDLGRLDNDPDPAVVSFVFRDSVEYGWVTASNPGKGLMVGYIFKLSEYPWLNIWRNIKDGKPAARGLEFGTTGLHKPFGDMITKNTIFDRSLFEYCDANQTITKSYVLFLAEIPKGYKGVEEIEYSENTIIIKEKETTGKRDITIKMK
ncbi:MAG: hypothetical protein JXB48_05685 [Candidatus Latescibacteria bacterium]|nr:hypothetical protein [Candidatus Latescibacterota bacterium]